MKSGGREDLRPTGGALGVVVLGPLVAFRHHDAQATQDNADRSNRAPVATVKAAESLSTSA